MARIQSKTYQGAASSGLLVSSMKLYTLHESTSSLYSRIRTVRVEGSTPFLRTSNPRRKELRFPHRAVFVSMKTRCRTRRESCRCNVGGVQCASMEEGGQSWLCKREKLLSVSSETFPTNHLVPWRARTEGNLISCYEVVIIQLPIIEWVGPECVLRQRMELCDSTGEDA